MDVAVHVLQPDLTLAAGSPFQIIDGVGTRARGINDSGVITGNFNTGGGNLGTGLSTFVGPFSTGIYQILNDTTTGDPNVLDTAGQGINNADQVVGFWDDTAGNTNGFIASPASLPCGTTINGGYVFCVNVVANGPIFLDPLVAVGYDYAIGAGDPDFASVTLPIGIGDSIYTLSFDGMTFSLAGGVMFDFTNYFAGGIEAFEVTGIDPSAGLDPANPQAFPTELTFVGSGEFTGTMTPITAQAPEPASFALLGIGLAGLGFSRRRRKI